MKSFNEVVFYWAQMANGNDAKAEIPVLWPPHAKC